MEKKESLRDWSPSEIRDAIKEKGLPIDDLAKEWGYSSVSLYRALKGSVSWDIKELVAGYLGLSLATIWPAQVALRQEKAERRARSLLEAKAVAARQVA